MLVLSRMINERIMIGDDIVLTVVDCRWNKGRPKVRLGIEAPGRTINREEVHDDIRINGSTRRASRPGMSPGLVAPAADAGKPLSAEDVLMDS